MRIFILISAISIIFTTNIFAQRESDFEISKNLDIYATIFQQLNLHYVDEIHSGALNTAAIEAMLKSLDPYTNYYAESQMEEVKFIQTGNYGGTGSVVIIQNDTFVVAKVMQGYSFDKNNIKVGDRILKIGNESCIGINMDDMSELLKGPAGTKISITFQTLKNREITVKNRC